jgi:hypothetical protein
MAFGDWVGVIGIEMGGALSAAASGHHSLFFARQPLKETFKLAPFVDGTGARKPPATAERDEPFSAR